MRIKKVFEHRQTVALLAVLIVGVILLTPTLIPFTAEELESEVPLPDVEPNIRVSAWHTPETIYPNDTVLVTASFTTTYDKVSEVNDNNFVLSQMSSVTIVYDDGVFDENRVTMAYDSSISKYKGTIPAYPAGTTITYSVWVQIDSTSGHSGGNSYFVSYPEIPYEPPEQEAPDMQDIYPPSYIINDVILANGQHITWSDFLKATVWGTIRLSVTFVEGGNNIATVHLKALSLETGVEQWFSFGRAEGDYYTWILDWDTTKVADGEYGMQLRMGVIPEDGGGGVPSSGITYAVMSSFGIGDGLISSVISSEMLGAFVVALFVIFGISLYYMKIKKK